VNFGEFWGVFIGRLWGRLFEGESCRVVVFKRKEARKSCICLLQLIPILLYHEGK
jgi:hypothetical protein